jgi:glycosyltransferase involved in cell wall biosynthesis
MESKDNRPKILVAVDWFTPAYRAGGPIRSVSHTAQALQDDFNFYVVCSAYDLGKKGRYDFESPLNVPKGSWIDVNGVKVRYLPKDEFNQSTWMKILDEIQPEALYINSMFSTPFSRLPLAAGKKWSNALRIVLAPRGMLDPGSLSIKPLKKYVFLSIARILGLYDHITWKATSEIEANSIRTHFPNAQVSIAQNLAAAPINVISEVFPPHQYLTVARVHPLKNQLFAAKLLGRLAEKNQVKITYQLIGHIEDPKYLAQIQGLTGIYGKGKLTIEAIGALPHNEIPKSFLGVRALLAPSLNENFGHAIAESLSIGCPVLVSDQTPWTAEKLGGAGRQLPLEEKDWDAALDWLADETAWKEARRSALENFSSAHSDPDILAAHRKLWAP